MSTQKFDGTDWNTGSAQSDVAASVESIETDLDDLTDPYRLEVPLAIDDQGQFLAWVDAEGRIAPVTPSAVPPSDEARVTDITQDGFKRFTVVDAAESTAFHPSSEAIDAVFAELEASAKTHVEPAQEPAQVPTHEHAPVLEVEAHAETAFNNQSELEIDAHRPQIDTLALEDSFEQVPFDAPALIGEQSVMIEVEAQIETETQAGMNPAASEFGLENIELEAMLAAISSATESQDTTLENPLEQDQMAVYEMEGVPVTDLSKQLENHMLEIESAPVPISAPISAPIVEPAIAQIDETTKIINLPMLPATTIMRRHFDATDLIQAQMRLQQALLPLEVSVLALLARAAERCSLELPGINSIVLAELAEHGVGVTAQVKAVESFREVLAGIALGSSGATGDLCVLDIRALGLSETILRLVGPHLLLTQLSPHPEKPGRMRGTISLCGCEHSQTGASFLDQVVSKLEAPITLMV